MIKVIKHGRDIDKDIFGIVCWNCDCEFTYQKEDIVSYQFTYQKEDRVSYMISKGVYCPNCHEFHEHSICNLVIKKRKN